MLLQFPPPKEKASRAKTPEALKSKSHPRDNNNAALMQALDNVKMHSEAALQNLIARALVKYLAEGQHG